jgi:type II secretory pathway component PulL
MLKPLPFKKEYLLAAAAFLLLLLSYQLAFKRTIAAWQLNHQLKQQLAQSADISAQPQYQERKSINLEKIISLYRADSTEFRGNILSDIASLAAKEQVKLSGVPVRDPVYRSADMIIQRLNFEGNYFALTKALDRLQNTQGVGMVRSAAFKTGTDLSGKEKVKKLTLEVYCEICNK